MPTRRSASPQLALPVHAVGGPPVASAPAAGTSTTTVYEGCNPFGDDPDKGASVWNINLRHLAADQFRVDTDTSEPIGM